MKTKTAPKPKAKAKATTKVNPIPAGFHTITATIICKDAPKAIAFYKKALGATEIKNMTCSMTGKVGHAELKVGDSIFFISDEFEMSGCMHSPTSLWLYVNDADAAFKKAIAAGATEKFPVTEMFWGDKMGQVTDPFGHSWTFATHTHDYTPAQIKEGEKAFVEQMKAKFGSCSSKGESSCS